MARSKMREDGVRRTETVLVYLAPDEKEKLLGFAGLAAAAVLVRKIILDWMDEQEESA